jgi:hypothetical protein
MASKSTTSIIGAIVLFFTITANGQKKTSSISIGPSIDFPLNSKYVNETGYGTSIRGYWGVGKQESILINVYFATFPSSYFESKMTLSGIKLGYKSYVNSQRFYVYVDGGFGYNSGDRDDAGRTGFAIGTGPGYSIRLGQRGYVDVSASANILFLPVDKTWVELYFAYRYDLKRK